MVYSTAVGVLCCLQVLGRCCEVGRKRYSIDKQELKTLGDSGVSIKQIAKHFGCSVGVINKRRREYGIQYGRGHSPANQKANAENAKRMPKSDIPLDEREKRFIERLANDERTKAYEYVGGYSKKTDKLTIRCKTCGSEREVTPHQLFDSRQKTHPCMLCAQMERDRVKEEQREIAEKRKEEELAKPKFCRECGGEFHSEYENAAYCSKTCKARAKKQKRDHCHRRRARRYGVAYDPSITWQALSRELGHCRCQICGKECDTNDKSWNGVFGPLFPTVDCIVPMSKGGGYVRGNVQLAHAICNSAKRDLNNPEEISKAVLACQQ